MMLRKSRYGQWTVALAALTVILALPIAAGAKGAGAVKPSPAGRIQPITAATTTTTVSKPKPSHVTQRNGQRHASMAGTGKHHSCGGGSAGPSGSSGGAPSGPVVARSPGPQQPVQAASAC